VLSSDALWPARMFGVGAVAFLSATLAAVTGFGGAAVLLPVLVAVFGVREAVPILTVAQLVGNGSRVWFNRRALDLAVVRWYALGAVPLGLLGGYLFARAPLAALTRALGAFLVLLVVWRRARPGPPRRPPLMSFAAVGAGSSFLSALLGSVGPLMAPFFLAYGLVKGAYIGTEALATVVTHVAKLVAYGGTATLSRHALTVGVALGPVMVAGSYTGKRVVDWLPEAVFVALIETTMLAAGLLFLVRG
jgi:uncharacterized membrane protein YfcA